MNPNTRDTILSKLTSASQRPVPERPQLPPMRELAMDRPQLVQSFIAQLTTQGGIAHHVADRSALLAQLADTLTQEHVSRAMATTDAVLAPLRLDEWGRQAGIGIVTPPDFSDRTAYTQAVFDQVQAGISGADFGVAESGTLVLAHDAGQARLVSLAPVLHIAVLPVTHIVPVYESAIEALFTRQRRPSQVTLITGPSMTADIQGTPFKGMHGPQKLVVLIVDNR